MTTKFIDHLLEGDHASRPAFGDVPEGTLYACSTHGLIYQSDGSTAWSTWATLGGSVAAADVSVADVAGNFTGTDAEAVLAELQDNIDAVAGGSAWTQVVNLSGASFTGWTGHSGTWASNGTIIQQTATGASVRRARYDTRIPAAGCVVSAEVRLPTGGSAVRSGGLLLGWPGADAAGGVYVAIVDDASDTFQIGRDATATSINLATTVALDTWYTLKVRMFGNRVDGYKDGTLIGSGSLDISDFDGSYLGLRAFDGTVDFRNIKLWALTLPS